MTEVGGIAGTDVEEAVGPLQPYAQEVMVMVLVIAVVLVAVPDVQVYGQLVVVV